MPLRAWLDADNELVRAEASGRFTMDEIVETITTVCGDPRFRKGFDILSDHTGVTEFLTAEQARGMATLMESLSDCFAGARWAVVTTHPASVGMMRMAAVFLERVPMEMRTFSTEGEARAWLGRRAEG